MTDLQLICGQAVRLPSGIVGDSLLVKRGRVVAVGTESELLARVPAGSECDVHAYPDCFILPGIRDSHIHPVAYTALLRGASLHAAANMAEVQSILTAAAATGPGIVEGWNLNEGTLVESRVPLAADLDAAVSDRPVVVHRYDGHMAIANNFAMRLAGVGAATPDPPGGIIDRDGNGVPTGVLRETAIDLVATAPGMENFVDPTHVAERLRGLAQLGITSLGAMLRSGDGPWSHLGDEVDIVVAAGNAIPIKIHAFVTADTVETLHAAAAKLDSAGPRIDWLGVKRFADGSFGSHTAAMFEPFADIADSTGTLRLSKMDFEMATAAVAAGRSVAIHAIGDAAANAVLDAFEELLAKGAAPWQLRMEHASVMTAADIERSGQLGVVASVQPAFLGSEADWIESRVGTARLQRTYAFASLRRAGALVVGGSDSPVEAPDPWEAMALIRDRAGVVPSESLDAAAALEMYTTAAARALGEPEPLAIGSPADLAIVDRDPVEATPDELRATEVIATYVDGVMVDVTNAGKWWIDGKAAF